MLLGVNIDHIATLREARQINDPNPLEAVFILKNAGASQITLHLREDRRHIHDDDLKMILQSSFLPINLECASSPEMIALACQFRPHRVTLVPEKREEITTEGGLDLTLPYLKASIQSLINEGIEVSLFIDPTQQAIEQSLELGISSVELHTGEWANLNLMAYTHLKYTHHSLKHLELSPQILQSHLQQNLQNLQNVAKYGKENGLNIYAGHGLNYQNVKPIAQIPQISELNIGHSIIARAIFVGLEKAILQMRELIE